jgi:hypothetical protein
MMGAVDAKWLLLMCFAGMIAVLAAVPVKQTEAATNVGTKSDTIAVPDNRLFKKPGDIPRLLKSGQISPVNIPNPHWRRDACSACHKGKPTRRSHPLLNRNSIRTCNNCHETVWPHSYIHPVGMKPNRAMRSRMSRSFQRELKKSGGVVTCTTCHDLRASCLDRKDAALANPLFFRGDSYGKARTDICYECHDRKHFQRLNPHKQIAKSGKIIKKSCKVCHSSVPEAGDVFGSGMKFHVKQDLSSMCMGCHKKRAHPGALFKFGMQGKSLEHMVVPSDAIAKKMVKSQQSGHITLPLEPGSEKIFCGTCHNVHEKGVIKRALAAKGADSKNRLREQQICINCHEK